ncbi:phage antirepressor [Methylorubrum thiocyanatum]|uniref:phage antirepressor n=1 Tax=Methylorubrum TaxID=2282523 RepID=UPI000DB3FECA|nr:phage antirepressor KilAC domain-containing protein [Methylorubrum populi]PZP68388.1 MAG: hypothetical protein DI590_16705 [Methylorubrum populi]
MTTASTQLTIHEPPRTMTASITPFDFEGTPVRVVSVDGEPCFVAADLARSLGYRDAVNLVRILDEDEVTTHIVSGREIMLVTEPGLYHAITARRQVKSLGAQVMERIARFKRWVHHDVIPSIRKTGAYSVRQAPAFDPEDPAALRVMLLGYTEKLIEARAERDEARAEAAVAHQVIEHQAPAVEAYEHLLDDSGTCCLADAARILGAEQKPFFAWLRKSRIVFDKGEALLPRADLRKDGRFRVRLVRTRPGEHREQTLVTRQGMIWLSHRWAAKLAVDAREAAAARIQATLDL